MSRSTQVVELGSPNAFAAAGANDGLISQSLRKTAALSRQLEGFRVHAGQDSSYYDIKRTIVTQLWQQLERLNDEVLNKYPDPVSNHPANHSQ